METDRATAEIPAIPAVATRFYRPELDALRLLAFLMVFMHHCLRIYPVSSLFPGNQGPALAAFGSVIKYFGQGAAFGVGLFFTLSAYLISTLLLIERRKTGRVSFGAFYIRRTLRIWPLYFAFLCLCPILGWIWPEMSVNWPQAGSFVLFGGNWFLVWHGFHGSPLDFLWSVCLEEQFYLLWPAVVAWRGRQSLVPACLLFAAGSAFTLLLLGHRHAALGSEVWCNSFVQFLFFAAGGLLAVLFFKRAPAFQAGTRGLLLVAGFLLLTAAAAATHIKDEGYQTAGPLLLGYGTSLIGVLAIFLGFLGAPAAWVPASVRYLGRISYGLYVFHVLCIRLASKLMGAAAHALPGGSHALTAVMKAGTPLLALGATFGLAHFSYMFLEAPLLRVKNRFEIVRSREV